MSKILTRLWRSERAASAAEFSLVLPLMIVLLLIMVDVGRFMWMVSEAEKATQAGARFAVVTDPVSPGLVDADFASGTLPAGELIPADALGALACTSSGCTCATSPCDKVTDMSVNATAFNAIVARMQAMNPDIKTSNVKVTYRGSGFGFAGNPVSGGGGGGGGAIETMEISPLVTVSLTGMQFTPIAGFMMASFNLPPFSSTLPAEDAAGTFSN